MKKISFLGKINLFIRSLIFSLLMLLVTFFYSFICICAFPLPLRFRCAMIVGWTRLMIWGLKVICQVNYHVEGLENIPPNRNGIVLSKHQSTWETFFLQGLFYQTAIILKRELLWVPFFGWGLAIINPIAINRQANSSALDQVLKKGKKCLDAGRWILIFPEGTRISPGKVGKYHSGGARLATATGYPIIPVAHNAGYYWPKRKFIKRPGTIQVIIGPLIETKDRPFEEVLEQVKNWIETTVRQIGP